MRLVALVLALTIAVPARAQQAADPDFKPTIASPAFAGNGPVVGIDEAHANFHTIDGRYEPFAALLRLDGYRVVSATSKFSAGALRNLDVLVIANAGEDGPPVFTQDEADALHRWVADGGSLLLIADHEPFGASAALLAKRFGVEMGQGWAYELSADGLTTQLVFSRENGRLGSHPIIEGRNARERVNVVRTFTGQSLSLPSGATALLRFSDGAREASSVEELTAVGAALRGQGVAPPTRSIAGRVQGLAMSVGRGRLVVLGEAAMFSAQVTTFPDGRPPAKAGMNVPGTDDMQFALNVMRWLAKVLDPPR